MSQAVNLSMTAKCVHRNPLQRGKGQFQAWLNDTLRKENCVLHQIPWDRLQGSIVCWTLFGNGINFVLPLSLLGLSVHPFKTEALVESEALQVSPETFRTSTWGRLRQGRVTAWTNLFRVCCVPKTMWFFVVLFTRFAYSVSPGQVDREPDSGHIWMQFPFKLMLKHLP